MISGVIRLKHIDTMFYYFLFLIFLMQLTFISGKYVAPGPISNVTSWQRHESWSEHGGSGVYGDVSISYKGRQICSGTLISKNHVVTAAECISGHYAEDIGVTVHSPSSLLPNASYTVKVVKAFVHPGFGGSMQNNIGILKIEEKVPDGFELPVLSAGGLTDKCIWEAWRSIRKGKLRVDLDILENKGINKKDKSECKEAMRDFKNMPQDFICVKAEFLKHYCPFQKGMGLTCEGKLSGLCIVATCSREAASIIYLDISQYRQWIKNVVSDIHYDPTHLKRVRRSDDEGEEGGGEVSDDEPPTEPTDGAGEPDRPDKGVIIISSDNPNPTPCFITNADAPRFPNYYGYDPREDDYDLMDDGVGSSLRTNVFPGIFGAILGCFLYRSLF